MSNFQFVAQYLEIHYMDGQVLFKIKNIEWLNFDDDVLSSTLVSQCDMNYV